MRWDIIILIPIIALAVLILASVFRGEADKRRIRQASAPEDESPAPSRPPEDRAGIDRFLQEIQARQRAREAERPAPILVTVPPAEPTAPETARGILRPPVRALPRAVPLAIPVTEPSSESLEVAVAAVAVEAPPPRPAPLPRAIPVGLAQFSSLLWSPSGLRTAVLMREILDPPLCRRRRRGA